jgi:uncharacterized protein (TIGR01777 family)
MTGGTGFIGTALLEHWQSRDVEAVVFTRSAGHRDRPGVRYLRDLQKVAGDQRFDAVINLAGESMAGGRWTDTRKAELVASRVDTTRLLAEVVDKLQHPPGVVLSASAIGIYGHQGNQRLTEDALQEEGFSNRLCQAWEAEAQRLASRGSRLCLLRLGVVLGRGGGALEELSRSFRFGVGTWLGSGQQWLSWIHMQDVLGAIDHLLDERDLSGAFNLTAPEPVTAREFCAALARRRKTLFSMPVPAVVMRVALGEMADELLLNGQRVVPEKLQAAGYRFHYPVIDQALANLVG